MAVIEAAKERLNDPAISDWEADYWKAYLNGAYAQAAEDLRAIRKELECEKNDKRLEINA